MKRNYGLGKPNWSVVLLEQSRPSHPPDAPRPSARPIVYRSNEADTHETRESAHTITLGENIHLGHVDRAGGQELVERAAALAGADEVAATLRSHYNTLLARAFWGGEWLSGGQFQRVAVARAFYRSLRAPGLLVLDEPTSDLDPRAEHRIFHNLRTLAAGRATILVTHNLDNAVLADRIVVMRGGRIAEEGTFAELASGAGLFRELLDLKRDRDRKLPGQRR